MIKGIIKAFGKGLWETITLGDNPIAKAVYYFSAQGILERNQKDEAVLAKRRSAKYEVQAKIFKQAGMAIEREYQARELESGLQR
jgi:hypothetical protein